MNKVEQLARRIQTTSVTVTDISKIAGVSRQSIMDIRDGKTTNPGFLTLTAIEGALEALEAAQAQTREPVS